MALSGREFLYKTGLIKTKKLPAKVISIGNITLGGTGKTPAVIALAQEVKNSGLKPCILTRGYKGKAKGPCLSSKNNKHFLKTHLVGDEAALMAYRLKDIPVVKGVNRFLSGVYALGELGPGAINVFILDDGFQHKALFRDIDILLVDATNPFGNERLFPEGILREPLDSMKRADIVVITKCDMVDEEPLNLIKHKIRQYNPNAHVYNARYEPASLIHVSGKTYNIESIYNRKVYVFSGIANPSYFQSILKVKGANIVKLKTFRDHHYYTRRDINKIIKEAQGADIITTEKDIIKLKDMELPDNIFALRIEFVVDKGFYEEVFSRISA